MKPVVGAALTLCLGLVLAACTATESGQTKPSPTDLDLAKAATVAALESPSGQDARVSSASYVSKSGTPRNSNTGHPCLSGRVLKIKIIGTFPHIVVTGDPGRPTDDPGHSTGLSSDDPTGLLLTVDQQTGETCLIGVGTGAQQPAQGATQFVVDVPGITFLAN